MSLTRSERIKEWFRSRFKLPLGVVIAICVFPVFMTALYYLLRSSRGLMDWVVLYISAPVRSFFGLVSSIYPFAVMEILCTAAVIFVIYYTVRVIRDSWRRRKKWRLIGKRLLPVFVVACYYWCMFCWFWSSGYHATGFAENNGFSSDGIALTELISVTELFADKANELSEIIERDEDGRYVSDRRLMFAQSTRIYRNISGEFPSLKGRIYAPKSMLFSWFMSITGYSGMYFALTGEAMINTHPPDAYLPVTVAHEHAHQLGVFAEDEASFVGILACVTSGNEVFEYAGYMSGLNYLLGALYYEDHDEWQRITDGLTEEVKHDRYENYYFWATRTIANTGITFLDNFLTSVAETTNETVNSIYDGFLKSQNQELGLKSYGACVDLLVEYFVLHSGVIDN